MTNVTAIQAHRSQKNGERMGTVCGLAGGVTAFCAGQKLADSFHDNFIKEHRKFSRAKREILIRYAHNAIDNSMARKFGVRIHNLDVIPQEDSALKDTPKCFQEAYKKFSPLYKTVYGQGSHYTPYSLGKFGLRQINANEILVNLKEMPGQVFHELGHAINSNTSNFWKAVQGSAPICIFGAAFFAVYGALSKNSVSKKDNGELSKAQKVNDFIRKHSAALSMAAMAPAIAEEIAATKKGKIYAANYCGAKDYLKQINKASNFQLASHLTTRLAIPIAGAIALGIKNYMIEKGNDKAHDIKMSGEAN